MRFCTLCPVVVVAGFNSAFSSMLMASTLADACTWFWLCMACACNSIWQHSCDVCLAAC
jgi:hypothetical protein